MADTQEDRITALEAKTRVDDGLFRLQEASCLHLDSELVAMDLNAAALRRTLPAQCGRDHYPMIWSTASATSTLEHDL